MCAYSTENERVPRQACRGLFEAGLAPDRKERQEAAAVLSGADAMVPQLCAPPCEAGSAEPTPGDRGADDLAVVRAGWAEEAGEGCVTLDPAAVLKATRRSFALRVRGQSMIGAGICEGDIVIGEFTPEARPGAIVVALIDGESTLKRFVLEHGKAYLASENPNYPDLIPLSELVIQGVVHTVVRRVR